MMSDMPPMMLTMHQHRIIAMALAGLVTAERRPGSTMGEDSRRAAERLLRDFEVRIEIADAGKNRAR